MFDPAKWFWLSDDGRIFDSAQQRRSVVPDDRMEAFLAVGHSPTRWPSDSEGEQTDQALQEVLDAYGLAMDPPSLGQVKSLLVAGVDADAEAQRHLYITGGAGQAMTYARKAEEAHHFLFTPDPINDDYPLLAAEVGITAPTLSGVAQVVSEANAQWLQIGAAIEAARLSAKKAISEATTTEEAQAASEAVVWPKRVCMPTHQLPA